MNEQGIRDVAADSIALKKRFFDENARLLMEVGGRMAEKSADPLATPSGGSASSEPRAVPIGVPWRPPT